MKQISFDEITWESILYDEYFDPFPYKTFKDFDKTFVKEIQSHFLDDDFI